MKYEIQGINDNPYQTFTVDVPNVPNKIKFTLRFMPTQMAWYMDIVYDKIVENGIKVVLSPNLLRCYKNLIPFGLSVYSEDFISPLDVTDFQTGRVHLYIIDEEYVENLEECTYDK